MGLGNLKKNNYDSIDYSNQDEEKLDELISGAAVKTSDGKQESPKKSYVRCSYSLTDNHKQAVIKLTKLVPFKCSESQVIKAAIDILATMNDEDAIKTISKNVNKLIS